MSVGYTYEIWDGEELRQWGCYATADYSYQGPDLVQVAAETVNVLLGPPPGTPPVGEFRLWPEATGNRPTGEPAYVADLAALRDG